MADLPKLTEVQTKVACRLHLMATQWGDFDYGYGYYGHNSIIDGWDDNIGNLQDEVGGRKGLSKILKQLRELGVAKFARGLMTEDGEVAGSGHAPHQDFEDELAQLCEQKGWK